MFQSQISETDNLLTANIIFSYSDVKLISKTSLYHLYEGKSRYPPYSTHTIRAFNFNSQFARESYDAATSLFIKELLHLVSIDPDSVLVNTFEKDDKKMAFATLSYAPLSYLFPQHAQNSIVNEESKEGTKPSEFSDINCIQAMISDLLLDIEFLSNELRIKDCSSIFIPQSIYKFKESGAYFVGDWLTAIISESNLVTETGTSFKKPSSPEISKEMVSLGLSIMELVGIHPEVVKDLRAKEAMKQKLLFETTLIGVFSNKSLEKMSREWKDLLERMLDSNVDIRIKVEEFKNYNGARRKPSHRESLLSCTEQGESRYESVPLDVTSQGESYTVNSGLTAEKDLINNIPDTAKKVTIQNFDDWANLATFHKVWQYFEARPSLAHLTLNWSNKGIANNPHMRAGDGADNIFRKADRTARLSLCRHLKHLGIDLSDNDITTIRALTDQLWDLPNLVSLNLKLRVTAGGLDQTSIDDLISTFVEVPGVGGNVDGKNFPSLTSLVIDLTGNVIQFSTDQRKKLRHWYPGVKIVVNDPSAPANLYELP